MKQLNNKYIINDEYLLKAKANLYKNYFDNIPNKYNSLIINSILLNRKSHLVSQFKDYLLYDDSAEFLKRFYNSNESSTRIKKISHFFNETSVLYPNYSSLIESKYIYSNIIKKQMIIIKQENYKKKNKLYNIKKHFQEKIDSMNKDENIFFNSTIYKDILNESESFLNILFGIEKKNKNEKKKNSEGEKFVEELMNIIDMIENNEKNCDDIDFNKIEIDKDNKTKRPQITVNLHKRNNRILSYENISDYNDNYYSNTSLQKKYKKKYKNIIKIEKTNKLFSDKKNINNNNEASKENNNNINSQIDHEQKEPNESKVVYHRKVKSTIIGDYLNKLELPSNSNVVNMLKIANETYADNANKNNMRCILYKTMRNINNGNNWIELKKNMNQMINLPQSIQNRLIKSRKNNNPDKIKENNDKKEIISNPKESNNNDLSKNGKTERDIPQKIEVCKYIKKPNYFGIKKRNAPLSTRNNNMIMTQYEKVKKHSVNNINRSNGNLFNNISSNTVCSNSIFNSCKKPENAFKSLYVNSNLTGPYSKPKCFDKKRYNGVSVKNLFNKSNEIVENEKEKMN